MIWHARAHHGNLASVRSVAWLKAIIRHWIAIAGGAVVAVIFLIASIWGGGYWLRILSFVTLVGSFICATFLSWRDERRNTIGKECRTILNEVVERSRGKLTVTGFMQPDEICALIDLSDKFGSEEDVLWVCKQLDDHGHVDPFGILGAVFEPGFDGKRLKFLQNARVHSTPIRSMGAAVHYVHSWAPQNGLTRKDGVA